MVEGNKDDRLGNLPDHILLTILDRLNNVREAARTSVLSTRWRQLPAVLSRLRINVWDFLPADASTCQGDEIVQSNAAAVEATKSILGRRESSRNTIQFLCIKFFLRDDAISIGHAVGHTMATHKVEIAEFIVFTEKDNIYCNDDDLVNYGRQFMSLFDACPDAFGGLTRLHLENLRFGESDISNVLNTCGRLKHLRLFNCDSGSCTRLQVEHSQLSELAIVDCSFESVVLSSLPKLTRMAFEGWISFQEPINFGYVPLLEAVGLTNVALSWHRMVKLSTFLGDISVRDLKLGFDCEKIWVQPEHLTKRLSYVFRQLRFVNLVEIPEGYDLTWTLFILEAAPNLKELYMTVWDHLCKMDTDPDERRELLYSEEKGVDWESSQSNFRHQNLATLTMFGFQLEDYMVNYVRRVIKAAVELQDAFMYIRLACGKCHTKPRKPYSFPFIEMQQTMVKERITDGIDSSARIHFLTGGVIRADHQAKMDYP